MMKRIRVFHYVDAMAKRFYTITKTALISISPFICLWCLCTTSGYAFDRTIVGVNIVDQSGTQQFDIPITFGQIFAPGEVPFNSSFVARAVNTVSSLSAQIDAKASHPDGSLRHAIFTFKLPVLQANAAKTIELIATSKAPEIGSIEVSQLLSTKYEIAIQTLVDGNIYTASAREALQNNAISGKIKTWLSGPFATEWIVMSPLKDLHGILHPHLTARFHIRAYSGLRSVRTDVVIENTWAYEPNPQGFVYDVNVRVGGKAVYQKNRLEHADHTRWHKVFWWGVEPKIHLQHNIGYLLSTGAIPNYDRRITVAERTLATMAAEFEPMSNGDLTGYMPTTGAHNDIGPLPRFTTIYLLTMDARPKVNMLANGGAGGSYHIHYRDKTTDLPVTLIAYPYMTLLGRHGDSINPLTGRSEAFPEVKNDLRKYTPDSAHQPSIAYVPYLVTGDYFFLEELQFWANWNMLQANPNYREYDKGLVKWDQVRGQAWSMRTLGHVAYISPDDDLLKKYFVDRVKFNLDWFHAEFINNPAANKLGWYARDSYVSEPGQVRTWQDDFFTWSMAYLRELGFSNAKPILIWKSKFPVGRMTDPGFCWLKAAVYTMQLSDPQTGEPYQSFAEIYRNNFGNTPCQGYEMDGYPASPTGYGANMQPALAVAFDAEAPQAAAAWARYETRLPKQDYSTAPQFAVIPRKLQNTTTVGEHNTPIVKGFALEQNYPNPGTPDTLIRYHLPTDSEIKLRVFDINGRQVAILDAGMKAAGHHTIRWDGTQRGVRVANGNYFVQLQAISAANFSFVQTQKIIVMH